MCMVELGRRRISINREIRELYRDADIVTSIGEKRLEWSGHIAKIDQGKTVKKIFDSKMGGIIRRGKPK